jgi:hypothetical protein
MAGQAKFCDTCGVRVARHQSRFCTSCGTEIPTSSSDSPSVPANEIAPERPEVEWTENSPKPSSYTPFLYLAILALIFVIIFAFTSHISSWIAYPIGWRWGSTAYDVYTKVQIVLGVIGGAYPAWRTWLWLNSRLLPRRFSIEMLIFVGILIVLDLMMFNLIAPAIDTR